jgi:hypothetical protein
MFSTVFWVPSNIRSAIIDTHLTVWCDLTRATKSYQVPFISEEIIENIVFLDRYTKTNDPKRTNKPKTVDLTEEAEDFEDVGALGDELGEDVGDEVGGCGQVTVTGERECSQLP